MFTVPGNWCYNSCHQLIFFTFSQSEGKEFLVVGDYERSCEIYMKQLMCMYFGRKISRIFKAMFDILHELGVMNARILLHNLKMWPASLFNCNIYREAGYI
jgi:hypothetical protein